ncbi:MAG TPA: hypothetical protein K8W01_00445 [Methylorubrum populi]|uniref:Uncharacterized protein n=1 Tax=Methylorubrum populi TaxID=223967 RepID=A0A921JCR4_9HYPH|nr:hypothetical protein [Methylorubrum populi]
MSFSRPLTVTDLSSGEDRRFRRNRSRKSDHALKMREKRADAAKKEKVAAFFTREEHKALADALFRKGRTDPGAVSAYAALTNTIPTKRSGFVAVAPNAEHAAVLAKALRGPGINGFNYALVRLDEISGRAQPAGRPVDTHITTFLDVLGKLEAVENGGGEHATRAARAIAVLREATLYRGLIRTFVTHADAGDMADAIHAVGALRILVNEIDTIAGRAGFRPAA